MKDGKLFALFDAMNKGDYEFVDSLDDEELKKLSPFVISMWANGATRNTASRLIATDAFCNELIFPLHRHPRLLLKLFISANEGNDNCRYKFKKCISKNESSLIKMISDYYRVDSHTAKDYARILPKEDIDYIKSLQEE